MPKLLNPKHEQIALLLSEGKTAAKAYSVAYGQPNPKACTKGAGRLMREERYGPAIRARRDEFLALDAAKEKQVLDLANNVDQPLTKDWVLRRLMRLVMSADQEGNLAVQNRALELLGKEVGLFRERRQDRAPTLDDLTLDDLTKLIAELEADPETQAALAETSALSDD